MNRSLVFLSFFAFFWLKSAAQETLVYSAPNDTFDLSELRYGLTVTDFALTRGQNTIPMSLQKPVATNLLQWRYFDAISGQNVLTRTEPVWTERKQLIDDVPPEEMLSLHINLDLMDSLSGQMHQLLIVIAGVQKSDLAEMPLQSTYDEDTYALRRFAAIFKYRRPNDAGMETYDCIEGVCELDGFNPQKGTISGAFDFVANRIGQQKLGFFLNGVFSK